MTTSNIDSARRTMQALEQSPVVQAELRRQEREAGDRRRAAIERLAAAEKTVQTVETSVEQRLARLESEIAPLRAKWEAAAEKLRNVRELLDAELMTARSEVNAATRA